MATMQRNILIVIGHPDPAPGRCLRALTDAYARGARASRADLMSADHLLLCYPLWLGDVPALFKGFLEQVLRMEAAGRAAASHGRPAAGALRSEQFAHRHIRQSLRLRHRFAGHLAQRHVEAGCQMRIISQCRLPALVGQRKGEWQRHIVQREG